MITSRLMGGLGNQMFQIAAIEALAKKQDDSIDVAFSAPDHYLPLQGKSVKLYKDNIFRNVNIVDDGISFERAYKAPWSYQELPFYDNVCYEGYFQCEKHFSHCSEYIRNLFSPTEEDEDYNNKHIT